MRVESFVWLAAFALPTGVSTSAWAQDSTPAGGEPVIAVDPGTLSYDYLVDGNLAADDPGNRRFRTVQAAYAAAPAGTAERPTVIGIAPNVYLLPPTPTGNSLDVTKSYITLLGLSNNRRSVVLADNRGNQQGGGGPDAANNNGYVIVVNADGFSASNLTILNYCNTDYAYPGDASKNLTKRSAVITQAVALQATGDKHVYKNVALLSRLDTMFLRTTRSYFENVFIEGTDDFIGGGSVSVWENSQILFPTGSGVMSAGNVAFVHSTFSAASALQFSKGAGAGVALINVVMPGDGAGLSWVEGTAPLRPSQNYLTYRVTDTAGNAAIIADGSSGAATFEYSYELSDAQAQAFNPWNLLRATPTGVADDWDPAGVRQQFEAAGQGSLPFRLALTGSPASVRTGGAGATLGATVSPARADQTIRWSTPSSSITLSRVTGPDVMVAGNTSGAPEYVPVIATAANGLHATAWVFVEPPYLDPPTLTAGPTLSPPAGGQLTVDYAYDLAGHTDQSLITWSLCDAPDCVSARDVALSRDNQPLKSYTLTPGDVGKRIRVGVQPKHNVSEPGPAVFALSASPITACDLASSGVSPNFRNFVETENTAYVSGLWTVRGTWTVQAGDTLVNGYGIRAGSQGASLAYQEDSARGDMRVALTMTPEKTSGAGFGSPGGPDDGNTIQKSDIYIKYDPRTQTGYSLRFWRTTQSTSQCMFQLYRLSNGVGTPLNDTQVLSGVFHPNTELVLTVAGDQLSVEAHNDFKSDSNSDTLSLQGTITPNAFGGAGVAWYGTVPRGNSNVYSRIEISYPGAATSEACPTPAATTPAIPPAATTPAIPSTTGGSAGCALDGPPRRLQLLLGTLLAVFAFAAILARGKRVRDRR